MGNPDDPAFTAFQLKGDYPDAIHVRRISPPECKTAVYSVIAIHHWAERIICGGCYFDDACGIAELIGNEIGIPFVFPNSDDAKAT